MKRQEAVFKSLTLDELLAHLSGDGPDGSLRLDIPLRRKHSRVRLTQLHNCCYLVDENKKE